MGTKAGVGLLGLALVAGAAWWYRDALGLALARHASAEAPSAAVAGLRKCLVDGRVLYTNGGCPAGSRDRPLTGGSVSVETSPRPAPLPALGASGIPNARDLLTDKRAIDITDKRIDEVIGR